MNMDKNTGASGSAKKIRGRYARIYAKNIRLNYRANFEYKGWWLMMVSIAFQVVTDPLSTVLLFSRFGSVGAWGVERIIMVYAMAVASFGLAELFCRGFDYFPWQLVRSGAFDRMLLRPVPLFVQIAGSFFHLHRIVRVGGGLCAVFWSLWKQGVTLDAKSAAVLAAALLSGFVVYSGVFIITSGISIFTIKALDWIYIFTNASYQVARCPVEYMPKLLKHSFTFLMPVLLISYYPAAVICGWEWQNGRTEPFYSGLLCVPAAAVFAAFSFFIWKIGVRKYQSTGS